MQELSADVVVVGGGGAGLAAAAEASHFSGRVIVLEKQPDLGGTTALAVGSIMASETDLQKKLNVKDSPRDHAADLEQIAENLKIYDDPKLRNLMTENVSDTVKFLQKLGVQFVGPVDQPPHRQPRLHQIIPSARGYISSLERHCRENNVGILLGMAATELVVEDQKVIGVLAKDAAGDTVRVLANKGVVLASGDVSANKRLMKEYVSPDLDRFEPFNPACTGDGQDMAAGIGAKLIARRDFGAEGLVQIRFAPPARSNWIQKLPLTPLMSKLMKFALAYLPGAVLRPFIMKFLTTALGPDLRVYENGAILVNKEGERFADELHAVGLHDVGEYERPDQGEFSDLPPNLALADQPGGEAFVIFDDTFAQKFTKWPYFVSTAPGIAYAFMDDYRRSRADLFYSGQSIEELAKNLGVNAEKLATTISEINRQREGSDQQIIAAPFHALGPLKAWIFTAQVGINVNQRLQVLNGDGEVIAGLYAAGSTGVGGFASTGHGHSLAWAFTSGRLAGRYINEDA
ncbi:MAG: FAD-dependent oxidoreductase [Rhodospirillaceae bacterium]|jgi:succinate dehydrogenase/fumarate reductase flavoprotein subunit|nr:FAD-dependent oxidoreductase [Rhodospirillaceae bacterium]MBT7268329.1 FAD-dependent oxidoreductase [Rhodospirillaceae bacterium]